MRLYIRFDADGTFATDRANLDAPFARGTYELKGDAIRLRAQGPGCVGPWTWNVGIAKAKNRFDDELHVVFVDEGCDVPRGVEWMLARVEVD